MNKRRRSADRFQDEMPLNLAIVGGGRACKFFLELLQREPFPYLNIRVVGVCDIDPDAQGFALAEKMGIYTTRNFRDLFEIPDLDSILELTHDQEVLLELIHLRPEGVGIVEHTIGRMFRYLFRTDQKLKSAEHQLVLEKMSSDFLIRQSNAAIVVLNTDFTIADANEAYLKTVGKTKEEVIGANCYEILHGYSAPCSSSTAIDCPMLETLRTGKSAHVIHELRRRDGEAGYDNIVTYPLKDQNGQVIRIIEIWRDITEEISNRWEKRVKDLKEDLNKLVQEDRMISLGKLAASCVHEINNPIQGLLTFSTLMEKILAEKDPGPEGLRECREYLSIMSTELERCGAIISGLLSFSREAPLEYKEIVLNDVLESVIALTRHKLKLHNIQLSFSTPSRALIAKGDANRLQQCFLNLIFNALEAMPDGGALSIHAASNNKGRNAVIEFRDDGVGIGEENLTHVFDPFFTTREAGEGTGLGLSIVHGVVKNHGGDVRVESALGEGSVFILSFPLLGVNGRQEA
ncbi:MAG: PAS domain-containing protein [Desulfobacterales bacterium]|nr:PAS domain-containing protein [Desulfobacterales bacterium]